MRNQMKGALWCLVLVCCLPWATQATSISPPVTGAFKAPMHMVQNPIDSSFWLAVGAGVLSNVYLQHLASNGDPIFTNHRLLAQEEQVSLDLQITADGIPLLLVEQKTYFPPFANRVDLHRLGEDGDPIWTSTIFSSENFSLGAKQFQINFFGGQVLVTWLDNETDFVQGQWLSLADGQLIDDDFVIVPTAAYSYATAVDDTMIVVAAANTVATISNPSAQLVLHELHTSYNPLKIECIGGGLQVFGISTNQLYLELVYWDGSAEYLQLDTIGQDVLPRELGSSDFWLTYRSNVDTIKAWSVNSSAINIGYGNGVHHHQLVTGTQGSSCVWRNAGLNAVYGQQLNQMGPLWNDGGNLIVSLITTGGISPFVASDGGGFGWLAALTPDYQLTVNPIDRNTPVNPIYPPTIPKELAVQAFPNPFNSAVNLQWQVAGKVEITIYSILGQVVFHQEVSSSQQLLWQPEQLASGQYFVYLSHQSGLAEVSLIYLK